MQQQIAANSYLLLLARDSRSASDRARPAHTRALAPMDSARETADDRHSNATKVLADFDATSISEEASAPARFLKALSVTPTGKALVEYVDAMAVRVIAHDECPSVEVATFRRVVMRALSGDSHACQYAKRFGVPSKPRKFLLVASVAGRRMIVASESETLVRMLTHGTSRRSTNDCRKSVDAVVARATELGEHGGVLLCYSMPFQVDIDDLSWEIRTFVTNEDGTVVDGQLAYALGDARPALRPSSASLENASTIPLLDAQIQHWAEWVRVLDVDVPLTTADRATRPAADSGEIQRWKDMCQMLKSDRTNAIADARREMANAESHHERVCELLRSNIEQQERFTSEAKRETELVRAVARAREEENKETRRHLAEQQAQARANEMLHDEDMQKAKRRAEAAEEKVALLSKQLANITKEHACRTKKITEIHDTNADKAERAHQDVVMRMRASARLLEEENALCRRSSCVARTLLRVAANRYSTLSDEVGRLRALLSARSEEHEAAKRLAPIPSVEEVTTGGVDDATTEATHTRASLATGSDAACQTDDRAEPGMPGSTRRHAVVQTDATDDAVRRDMELGRLTARCHQLTSELHQGRVSPSAQNPDSRVYHAATESWPRDFQGTPQYAHHHAAIEATIAQSKQAMDSVFAMLRGTTRHQGHELAHAHAFYGHVPYMVPPQFPHQQFCRFPSPPPLPRRSAR